jgi:hypothetical protein
MAMITLKPAGGALTAKGQLSKIERRFQLPASTDRTLAGRLVALNWYAPLALQPLTLAGQQPTIERRLRLPVSPLALAGRLVSMNWYTLMPASPVSLAGLPPALPPWPLPPPLVVMSTRAMALRGFSPRCRDPILGDSVEFVGLDGVVHRWAIVDGIHNPNSIDLRIFESADVPIPPTTTASAVRYNNTPPYQPRTWHWPGE